MRVFSNNGLGKLIVIFFMLGLFLALGSTMPAVAAEVNADNIMVAESPAIDVLYDGPVALTPDETFEVTAYNSKTVYTSSKMFNSA